MKTLNVILSFCLVSLLAGCSLKETLFGNPAPEASLAWVSSEAPDSTHLALHFRLELYNPASGDARLRLESWNATLDGQDAGAGAAIAVEGLLPAGAQEGEERILAPGETRGFPVTLSLNLERLLRAAGNSSREVETVLFIKLSCAYSLGKKVEVNMRSRVSFPLVREPGVSILSIGIRQAELVTTNFLVKVQVQNPNSIPVSLSAFEYELYNRGRLWAGGMAGDVLAVPASASGEKTFSIPMNFIGMGRSLFDEVANLRQVDYRFRGQAMLDTGLAVLPGFRWTYDQSGRAAVVH